MQLMYLTTLAATLELASNEDLYLKGHAAGLYGIVRNAPGARGRLSMNEFTGGALRFSDGLLAQVRQLNTENNPSEAFFGETIC